MKISRKLLLAIAAAGLTLSHTATADILTATYTGTVLDGFGFVTLFGTDNSNLIGQTVTSVYTYDTSLGVFHSGSDPNLTYRQVLGGSQNHNTSPMLSAILTIGGVSVNIGGSVIGEARADLDNTGNFVLHAAYLEYVNGGAQYVNLFQEVTGDPGAINPVLPLDLNTPYSWTPSQGGAAYGSLNSWGHGVNNDFDYYLDFNITSLNVAVVPEPSSVLLVGVGLAGIGWVRRKKFARCIRRLNSLRPAIPKYS